MFARMKLVRKFGFTMLFFWLISCETDSCETDSRNQSSDIRSAIIKYADNLYLEKTDKGLVVTIGQPFKGASSSKKYLLTGVIDRLNRDDFDAIIKVPIKSIVATATSQVGFIDQLESGSFLTGFTTTDFISSGRIRKRIASSQIVELGRDVNINIEELISLSPDILVAYSASANVSQWEQVENLDIPVVYDASFLETSPLAQAEWIKFFAALVGKSELADSIFNEVEKSYRALQILTNNIANKPTVICGTMYNGTWFMPGGQSWVATYIDHAGGEYLWNNIQQTGSVPLSFEAVYEKSLRANYWIGATAYTSYNQLINEDERYMKFEVVQNHMIYTPTNRMNGLGGNDYYESAVVRPDLVLKDFITILHPKVLPQNELLYYEKLE